MEGVASVRVGLYFDLRNPQRWRQDPARLHAFTLELCEEADRLGIDSLWFTEHHKFDDGYLTQPLTFAAAVAARTTRARLGTAVLVAPLHHPVRLAEEAALVDLISNGRLDIGLGAGYRKPEYDLYGVSQERRYGRTDAQVRGAARAVGGRRGDPAAGAGSRPAVAGLPRPAGRRACRPSRHRPVDRQRRDVAALPRRAGHGRARRLRRQDGRWHPGLGLRRPGTGLDVGLRAPGVPGRLLPEAHGRRDRPTGPTAGGRREAAQS